MEVASALGSARRLVVMATNSLIVETRANAPRKSGSNDAMTSFDG